MSKLAISKFFEQKLEAPLHNTVWSWGSENAKGIYLRAWNRTKVSDKFDIAKTLVWRQTMMEEQEQVA